MKLIGWNKNTAPGIRAVHDGRTDFVSVDPGNRGAAVIWHNGQPCDSQTFRAYEGYGDLSAMMTYWNVTLAIVEDGYAGKNWRASQRLAFWRGYAVHALVRGARGPLTCVEVPPATWQAKLSRARLVAGQRWDGAAKKDATLALYDEHAAASPDVFPSRTLVERDAIASALGIGEWWLNQVGDCRDD